MLVPVRVSLDGERVFDAYADPSISWNGFACPHFTFEVAKQIGPALFPTTGEFRPMVPLETWRYDGLSDSFLFSLDSDRAVDEEDHDAFEGGDYEVTEGDSVTTRHLYAIGAWAWTWHFIATDDT